jgi:hypothetical protein
MAGIELGAPAAPMVKKLSAHGFYCLSHHVTPFLKETRIDCNQFTDHRQFTIYSSSKLTGKRVLGVEFSFQSGEKAEPVLEGRTAF